MPESDISDSELTYRPFGDNVDTDVSANTQDESDPPSPPTSRATDKMIPPVVAMNNLNLLTSSDSDSCTDGEYTVGQTTSEASSTSESEETQM